MEITGWAERVPFDNKEIHLSRAISDHNVIWYQGLDKGKHH